MNELSGSGRESSVSYVRFLDPGRRDRSPYSVEGYLDGISTFASGAVRVHGWRRTVARVLVILLLLPVGLMVLGWLWSLLGLLVVG